MSVKMSVFAQTVLSQKYADEGETWEDVSRRVVRTVFKAVHASKDLVDQTLQYVIDRKFIPGGRYLYATGKSLHQVNNCLLCKAEDSREGWADHMSKHAMRSEE